MSVEIDVGLETADSVKVPLPEPPALEPAPKPLMSPKIRRALVIVGGVLVAVFVGLLVYFRNRESTDDARLTATLRPLRRRFTGGLPKFLWMTTKPLRPARSS